MNDMWSIYEKQVKKIVKLVDPEIITLANGQKAITGESEETGKMLYKIISHEQAKKLLKENSG